MMTTVIKTRIIKIGNSQGIRIPKLLIEQAGITEDVELLLEDDRIIISSVKTPRLDWVEKFQQMAEMKDDRLLDAESGISLSSWDEDEWTW